MHTRAPHTDPDGGSPLARLPWAAGIALFAVLWADRAWFQRPQVWEGLMERLAALPVELVRVESGLVEDRVNLSALAAVEEGRMALFMGNSRARSVVLPRRNPGLEIQRITHAPISPVLMRSFADDAVRAAPDAFVVLLSEMDTHYPVSVVPRATYASFSALADTLMILGPRAAFAQRRELEQWAMANVFSTYRYRDILARAWLDDLRRFDPGADGRFPALVERVSAPEVEPPPIEGLAELLETIQPENKRKTALVQFHRIKGIGPGPHVRFNEALLEATFRRLRDAGSEVLIVEGPLDPQTHALYDHERTRAEFVAFAGRMVDELGCHFLSLDETGPYGPEDFLDVLHLKARAGTRLGRHLADRLRVVLGLRELRVPGGR